MEGSPPQSVAIIASEAVPFAKTGGLADVAGSLPRALEHLGHSATLFLPYYRAARGVLPTTATGVRLRIPIGPRMVDGTVHTTVLPDSNVRVYLIEGADYFDRLAPERHARYHLRRLEELGFSVTLAPVAA